MMALVWKCGPLFLFAFTWSMRTETVQGESTNAILLNGLKNFNMVRHHLTNPRGKIQARGYIYETFISLGLHTWKEPFFPDRQNRGINVVGVLPGRWYRTRNDMLTLIGSHYDTTRTSNGADDNGSGVVAMLEVARQLSSGRCTRKYSVMFVAFDFEEWEEETFPDRACAEAGCGSRAFVTNFTNFYGRLKKNALNYGILYSAIIMDTMMNYNTNPQSQKTPLNMEGSFPSQYKAIAGNRFKGDFLIAVGRRQDYFLLFNFKSHYDAYNQASSKYKLQVFSLPFDGSPEVLSSAKYNAMKPFLRSDHVSFWNGITQRDAIFLSDTANLRSYMRTCYHENCDSLSYVTNDFLGFLSKSCDAVVKTTNDVTEAKCQSPPAESAGLTVGEGVAIGVSAGLLFGVKGIAIYAYYKRPARQRNESEPNTEIEIDASSDASQPENSEAQSNA